MSTALGDHLQSHTDCAIFGHPIVDGSECPCGLRTPALPENVQHCGEGHPLIGDNVMVNVRGDGRVMRRCRTCKNIGNRRRYAAGKDGRVRAQRRVYQ